MPALRGDSRTPYLIEIIYTPSGVRPVYLPAGRRKHLRAALQECRRAVNSWARLIGGQYPVLSWRVRDTRDGSTHSIAQLTREDVNHGERQAGPGRLF